MAEARILVGDCRDTLKTLPDGSVHCVVTSPPYYGLRDYGVEDQLGLEPTPDEYVAAMVGVFREVRRVLRDDGVLWLNLGDSYAAARSYQVTDTKWTDVGNTKGSTVPPGLKPKDLIGIPWRVAFALQADGWYLRSDIIWSKPNPMPESVRDRPTKAHEYLFLLSKSERYYYDADAIAEPSSDESGWAKQRARGEDTWQYGRTAGGNTTNGVGGTFGTPGTRNARSVWTIATQPYSEAHFATFPEELARRCIVAGTSQRGCCPECGAPWERIVERGESSWEARKARGDDPRGYHVGDDRSQIAGAGSLRPFTDKKLEGGLGWVAPRETVGWASTCDHDAEPVPCTVLDPFAGSGTVGAVAVGNARAAILCELNPEYIDMATRRIGPMFVTVADVSRSA